MKQYNLEEYRGRYIITGKISEGNKDAAYSVFGLYEQKSCLVDRKTIKNMIQAGSNIFGLELGQNYYTGKDIFRKSRTFLWNRIPELNGKGIPEKPEEQDLQVIIGCNGYKEMRAFVTVNSLGIIRVYTEGKFREQIKKDNIIGVNITKDNKVVTYIKNNISDDWLEKIGYQRSAESMMWEAVEEKSEQSEK